MSRKNSQHTVDMKAARAAIKESAEISAVAGIAFVAAAEDGRVADTIITGHRERFGAWASGEEYAVGQIRLYQEALYRCVQAHTAQDDWTPDIVPALWTVIDVEHSGGAEDPIPAKLNMEYFKGKYYSEDRKLYLCTRDSGIPLTFLPSQLVGQYFEVKS